MNLKNLFWLKEARHIKTHSIIITFIWNSRIDKINIIIKIGTVVASGEVRDYEGAQGTFWCEQMSVSNKTD